MTDKIIILDCGSQYTQLIARRVRELNVYSEIHPYNQIPELDEQVKGIIISGSPHSVRDHHAPAMETSFRGKYPVLGVCYGAQYLAMKDGGDVQASKHREYGRAALQTKAGCDLFKGMKEASVVWMSHGDTITELPPNFEVIASTDSVANAAFKVQNEATYGIQFHPEVTHSEEGKQLLENFILGICKCSGDWTPEHFIEATVNEIREKVGQDKVILGLSGGVDSSVAAVLVEEAIGDQLFCIFIDNGLLRKDEFDRVLESYAGMGLNVKGVRAGDLFLDALAGISDPEKKRKAIGKVFIDVFEEESNKIEGAKWLAQGTIYPDVIESMSVKGPSATIKSHHNVGGLPEKMNLKVLEPLRLLFKDEVRRVGRTLGIDKTILDRHPFPGPGLAIRILGDITEEKVRITQEADALFIQGLKDHGLYDEIWQAGAIFLPINSVGVMGDERTYENVICLRAVTSIDGMTADWGHLPHEFLARISNQIINQVKGINRVVYDISSKPPATIEWE
ncbi:MAG TPA: GMP synthase (glutamine-hydrolyzing) [Bacteroidetes bacterium]|nr:GMP synthase (glutamine-hydrolyzing) [Bacteroidota bacterium]